MKRKLTAVLLGLSLVASLTACGGAKEESAGSSPAAAPEAPAADSSAAETEESADTLMGSDSATVRFKVGTTTAPEGHYVKGLIEPNTDTIAYPSKILLKGPRCSYLL